MSDDKKEEIKEDKKFNLNEVLPPKKEYDRPEDEQSIDE